MMCVVEECREQLAESLAKGLRTEDTERNRTARLERQLAAAENMLQVSLGRVRTARLERQLAAAENMLQVSLGSCHVKSFIVFLYLISNLNLGGMALKNTFHQFLPHLDNFAWPKLYCSSSNKGVGNQNTGRIFCAGMEGPKIVACWGMLFRLG